MITKGTAHTNGGRLARYMTTGKDGERAELWQLRGFASNDIAEAFRSVHLMAEGTKCEQPFFHVQVRNRDGETLTREQWVLAANRIERMLGLTGQPRAIAFHIDEKSGHEHMHIAFSRIDQDTLTAKPLPFFKERLKKISRELELHFGLEPVTSRRPDRIKYAPTRAEEEQARRLGFDIHEIRRTIRECWDRSDCGRSFAAGLADQGLVLAQGDRRDFVVMDRAGGLHALGKRVLDANKKAIRERLADLDTNRLPSVEKARDNLAGGPQRKPERLETLRQQLVEVNREIYGPALDQLKHRLAQAERDYAQRDPVRDDIAWHDAVAKAAIEKEKTKRRFVERKDAKETRRGGRGKDWPVTPELPDPVKTSPGLHFEDAARKATQPQPAPEMPSHLKGPAAHIWTAYNVRTWVQERTDADGAITRTPIDLKGGRDPYQFAQALEEKGMTLARVTKDEAENSRKEAEHWKTHGKWQPTYRESEIVVVTQRGRVYSLNRRTTGHDAREVQAFLAKADWKALGGIEATKEKMQARAGQHDLERQSLRDEIAAARLKRAGVIKAPARTRGRNVGKAARIARRTPARAAAAVADAFTNALESLFAPPLTPERKREAAEAALEREADAVLKKHEFEFSNHLAALREQEQQRHTGQENYRKDRERDR